MSAREQAQRSMLAGGLDQVIAERALACIGAEGLEIVHKARPTATFTDELLWNWAVEIARLAQQAPHDDPQRIADRWVVLASTETHLPGRTK